MKQIYLLFVCSVIISCLLACSNDAKTNITIADTTESTVQKVDSSIEIVGKYTFGDGYKVEIENATDGSEKKYSFFITFDLISNDYLYGDININETYKFDGYTANDAGELKFTIENSKLFLTFSSEKHSYFKEELIPRSINNYTGSLNKFYGHYYSPTGMYGIELSEGKDEDTLFLSLLYSTGKTDSGYVTPGKETELDNYSYVTLELLENETVHMTLFSAISADGNFDEELYKGNLLDAQGISSASAFNYLNNEQTFKALCKIEKDCINMNIAKMISNPLSYYDNKVYRFPGKVDWVGDGVFLLEVADSSILTNNIIVCYSDIPVSKGELVCVYGNCIGADTYTCTYTKYGKSEVIEYTTLGTQIDYIFRDGAITLPTVIESYMEDVFYGEYHLKKGESAPLRMENIITINENSINGRAYSIKEILLDWAYGSLGVELDGTWGLIITIETTDIYGDPISFTCHVDLDKVGFTYARLGTEWVFFERSSY